MKATLAQYVAAEKAVRASIEAYSAFDSSLVSDALLDQMVRAGVDAALALVPTPPAPHPAPAPIPSPPPKAQS